ncbi:MAG: hypothetical protein WDN28_15200 [Chthoniobacter sp.]
MTAAQLNRSPGGGIALVNGLNLGKDAAGSTSVSRLLLTTAPTLIGSGLPLATGINSNVQNTAIVPYLLGEASAVSGGLGTASGAANTFVTYTSTGGLRPLNLADEFTLNAFTAGNNTHLTAPATLNASVAINSLILDTTGSITIASGQILTINSGAILFAAGTGLGFTGGHPRFRGE